MNELESLGITTLDDQRVKVRQADGTLTSISDMISSGSSGVTLAQVNSIVATAIAALVSDVPDALNTLGEISASLNDNDSAYATLLALIQSKNPLMTFPSSATSTNLLQREAASIRCLFEVSTLLRKRP